MRFYNLDIQEIKITNINATVLFKLTENNFIEIDCDNPEIQIKEENQRIIITNKDSEVDSTGDIKKNSVFVCSNNGRIVINNNVIINGNIIGSKVKEMPKAIITIQVPFDHIRYLDLAMAGVCQLEKISKKLSIKTEISTGLNVADIEKVSLDASGCTHALFKNIKVLNIDISGQSFIDVQNVKELEIDISGQSEIDIKSDILTDVKIDASGMGSIQIESKVVENLEADLSGMSQLNVFGKVLRKHVDSSGMSHYSNRE